MMMRYDVIGSISDFESDRLGSTPGISALCPIGGIGRHTRFKFGHHSFGVQVRILHGVLEKPFLMVFL